MGEKDEVIEYNTERWGQAALYNGGSDGEGEVGERGTEWQGANGERGQARRGNLHFLMQLCRVK
jgi:hypothetical protein